MKSLFLAFFGLFAFVCTGLPRDGYIVADQTGRLEIYFSPGGGAEQAIVQELNRAKTSIYVLAYSFTSAPIARALGQAKDRGLNVQVILDKSNRTSRYSVINYLQSHAIPVFIDTAHAIAHNKVMIVDGRDVITGSYNFTSSAERRNAENLLIIRNEQVAKIYIHEWKLLRAKAQRFTLYD